MLRNVVIFDLCRTLEHFTDKNNNNKGCCRSGKVLKIALSMSEVPTSAVHHILKPFSLVLEVQDKNNLGNKI